MKCKYRMLFAATLAFSAPLHARVTKIIIDQTVSPAFCKGAACTAFGDAGRYEQLDNMNDRISSLRRLR